MSSSGVRLEGSAGPETARPLAAASVAVLHGGASDEREVSLTSGRELLHALTANDGRGPAFVRAIEVDPRGRWLMEGRALNAAAALAELADVDVFFLGLHGGAGEDGTLQGLLESAGRRYTGSGVRASALCMDKLATRGVADACGLRTPASLCFSPQDFTREPERWLALAQGLCEAGVVVKPRCGGSSVATAVLDARADPRSAVEAVVARGDDCLVEARVVGVECSCGVLGNRGERLQALTPVEIRPAEGRFFDYQQKYAADGARELCPPEALAAPTVGRIQARARMLYAALGCDGYARLDFIVPPDGEPVLLEANTLPGFTPRSLLPLEAAVEGMDYRSLCLWVLAAALRRWGRGT